MAAWMAPWGISLSYINSIPTLTSVFLEPGDSGYPGTLLINLLFNIEKIYQNNIRLILKT